MQHIDVGGARLAVQDSGGDGPALIALHAGVADSRVWQGCTGVGRLRLACGGL